jgi:hypothetical protein
VHLPGIGCDRRGYGATRAATLTGIHGNRGNAGEHILDAVFQFRDQLTLMLFYPLALGDVSQDDRVEALPTDVEFRYRGFGRKLFTVIASSNHFLPLAHAARDIWTRRETFDVPLVGRVKTDWNENIDRLSENLDRRVAKHSLRGLVEEIDPMLGINGYDRVTCNCYNARKLRF